MAANNKTLWWIKIALTGVLLFILLFVIATLLYPGGSYTDRTAEGHSWLHNYICDMFSVDAKNGLPNSARPVAVIAWLILCFSISVFFYLLPDNFLITKTHKKIIRYSGVLVMVVAAAVFTALHDKVIYIGGIIGSIALIAIFAALCKSKMYKFFYTGLGCIFLIAVNYYIVLSGIHITLLPVIQKSTFLIILLWIFSICKQLYWNAEDKKPL